MQKKWNNRKNSPKKRKNQDNKEVESPAFVPRHIADMFLRLKGVTQVKPSVNTPERIEIILLVNQPYNHNLHGEVLIAENEIKQALKSRQQKFQASISW